MKTKTVEHIAWEKYRSRLEYLSLFDGNRSMIAPAISMMKQCWKEALEETKDEH